jgi:nucleotide-binding universal stress UspA family protein
MGRRPLGPWVVVGVDGSADALAATDLAAAEAAARGLRLRVVAASPCLGRGRAAGFAALADSAVANRAVAEAAGRAHLNQPDLTVRTCVVAGDPAETLIRESRTAGLVVVGGRGRGGGWRPGSACAQVAAHGLCPTLVVSSDVDRTGAGPDGPVLVGVAADGHDDPAVGFAFEEAAARGVAVRAAHVWSVAPDVSQAGGGQIGVGRSTLRARWAEADRRVADALACWVEKYPRVRVEPLPLYDANPARALLVASDRAGLAVLGTSLQTRYSGQPLGAITRVMIERAGCPVCVVGLG